jgi:hypothetical protein
MLARHFDAAKRTLFCANQLLGQLKLVPAPDGEPERFYLRLNEKGTGMRDLLYDTDLEVRPCQRHACTVGNCGDGATCLCWHFAVCGVVRCCEQSWAVALVT